MRSNRKYMAIGFIAVIFFIWLYYPIYQHNMIYEKSAKPYRERWIKRFNSCKSLQDIKRLPSVKDDEQLFVREFSDKSWMAVYWHSAHSNVSNNIQPNGLATLGWDGTLAYDSKGNMYWSDYHFCGEDMLNRWFLGPGFNSLSELYNASNMKLYRFKQITLH